MIRLSRILLLTLGVTLLASCGKKEEAPGYTPPATADRCVVLYMPGRTLKDFYQQNLDGISRAVNASVPGNGRMLVCWQPSNASTAVLQEIYYDTREGRCETKTLKEYTSFAAERATDVATLLSDAIEAAPAERYGLIIGCHGKAWVSRTSGSLSMNSADPRQKEQDPWIPAPGALPTRSFGDSGHELEINELTQVLEAQRVRFDYLIFDACFMANIETLYDLRNTVDYIVASPCEIMGAGFPYERITPHLFADQTPRSALEAACLEFWDFYENDWDTIQNNEQSGCISLAVTAELEGLATAMRNVKQGTQKSYDLSTLQSYEGFNNHLFFDLGHYVEESCGDQGLVDALNKQLDRAFPSSCRLSTAQFYSAYNHRLNPVNFYTGVSVSEPSQNSKAPECQQTAWYLATH